MGRYTNKMNKGYTKYLNSDYWKKRKVEFKSKTYKRCFVCRSKENLHVHHKRYWDKNGSILFREKHTDLRLLCKTCHFYIHSNNLEKLFASNKIKRKKLRDEIKGL